MSGRTMAKTKRPALSVTAVSTLPCVRLVSVTVTPGRTPPCESWTVPETDALVVCAEINGGEVTTMAATRASPCTPLRHLTKDIDSSSTYA